MKTEMYNDVSHLYQQDPVKNAQGKWVCPACQKEYARLPAIHKHMKEEDCAPARVLFEGTLTEEIAHDTFVDSIGDFAPNQRKTMDAFRRSKYYKGVLKFTLNCMRNKVKAPIYMHWIVKAKTPRYYNTALCIADKDSNLEEFRDHLVKYEELIDSEQFLEQNEYRLKSEPAFLVRSIERGDIGLNFCMASEQLDMGAVVDKMSEALRIRLLAIIALKEK